MNPDESFEFSDTQLKDFEKWSKKQQGWLEQDLQKDREAVGKDDLEDSLYIDPDLYTKPPQLNLSITSQGSTDPIRHHPYQPISRQITDSEESQAHSDTIGKITRRHDKRGIKYVLSPPPEFKHVKEYTKIGIKILRDLENMNILSITEWEEIKGKFTTYLQRRSRFASSVSSESTHQEQAKSQSSEGETSDEPGPSGLRKKLPTGLMVDRIEQLFLKMPDQIKMISSDGTPFWVKWKYELPDFKTELLRFVQETEKYHILNMEHDLIIFQLIYTYHPNSSILRMLSYIYFSNLL